MDPRAPSALKDIGRLAVTCAGCSRNQATLGNAVSMKRCSSCRTVAYCSAKCQRAHWNAEHKRDCKQRTLALGRMRQDSGDAFVSDWEQWSKNSVPMLSMISLVALREKAADAGRAGLTAEVLADRTVLFLSLEYTAGGRLPFKVLDEYDLVGYGEEMKMIIPDMADQLAAVRANKLEKTPPGSALFILCARMNQMVRIMPLNFSRAELRGAGTLGVGRTVKELLSVLNDGYAGAGTTRAAAGPAKPLTGKAAAMQLNIKADVRKWMAVALQEKRYTFFTFHALQMYCKPKQRLLKSHRIIIDAYFCPKSGLVRVKSFTLMTLVELLQTLYASLDADMRSVLEAKDSLPQLKASRVQYPTNELFPVLFRFADNCLYIEPQFVPLVDGSLLPRRSPDECKKEASTLFEQLKKIGS